MSRTDPHSLLGLAPGAGEREIKHAFRRLAMRWHPDRNADPAAIEHFKRLRAAYEDLLAGRRQRRATPRRPAMRRPTRLPKPRRAGPTVTRTWC